MSDGVTIRDLDGLGELRAAEVLQTEVWGEFDTPDNDDLLLAIQHEGGLVAGAFRDERMIGLVFGFPSATPGVQHSHRLAVHPLARGLGLGARLKWFQHDWCAARGIELVRWTYDPMRAVNASLNIAHLGGTATRYLVDYYGKMEGINAGLPSDRLMVDWQIGSDRVAAHRAGASAPPAKIQRRVSIPADLDKLLRADPAEALGERLRIRADLSSAFAEGLGIIAFDRKTNEYGLG